ncbi:MAG: LysM peptidoglycan-binding domain-containing protein [Hyphomicrobiaceae bacterium]
MIKRFQDFADAGGRGATSARAAVVCAVLLVGGCSADLGRFDFPSSNLNARDGPPPVPVHPGGGAGSPPHDDREPEGDNGRPGNYSGGTYVPPRASDNGRRVDMAALPEPAQPGRDRYTSPAGAGSERGWNRSPRGVGSEDDYAAASSRSRGQAPVAATPGSTIEVQRGDTLYGIARRHGVTVQALMSTNSLSNSTLRPGQQLRLPNGAEPVSSNIDVPRRREPEASVVEANPPAGWNGTHTVQSGDSLYKIARQHGIKVAELQSANGIANPRQLKPGMSLRVPGSGGVSPVASATATFDPARTEPAEAPPRVVRSTTQPTMINGSERRVAALEDRATASDVTPTSVRTAAVTPAMVGTEKLRWPAKGKILSGFGQRVDGTHNDGINIAVPQGADVHAAEEGEVAYAGSELKGYGNLILLRHDNGWVTAYAHNDQLLVKRGDKVRRGDIIAKAGKSGQVDQPQLHFELRQGSKPVDPLPYLERL